MKLVVLALLFGCAIGRVSTPNGTEVVAFVFANSYAEACYYPPPSDVGPEPKECVLLKSSTVSSIAEIIGAVITGTLLYFGVGA